MCGLYLPFVLILLALAARGVALEFRSKGGTARWRAVCDAVLAGSSLLVAALWGAVLGRARDRARAGRGRGGRRVGPRALGGAAGVDARAAGGGAGRSASRWCRGRRSSACAPRARCGPGRGWRRSGHWCRVAVLVAVVAPLGLVAVGVLAVLVAARREALAFAATSVAVAGGVVAVLAAHLPVVLPSTLDPAFSLTVAGAAASPGALRLITIAAVLVLPGVRRLPGVLVLGVPPARGQ